MLYQVTDRFTYMSQKRQQLIDTAIELFARNGYHATGIESIASHAGVSKKTMYQHFRSKEELIVAALRQHDGRFRNFFMKAVDGSGADAYERLLAIFDVAHEWFCDREFYGCMFINAIGEYSDRETAIREACKEFKRLMRRYIEELTGDLGLNDSEALAAEFAILLEGSIVTAQVSQMPNSASVAKHAAKVLLDNAIAARG